jgi:hypothetical protein
MKDTGVVALIWLAGGMAIAHLWRHPAGLAIGLLAACVGGTTLPDIDFSLWLSHRSALTHGVLPVALLHWWRMSRPIAGGAAAGVGLHLAADCFPNGMVGYATVKLPLIGSFGTEASYLWLALNALAALAWSVAASASLGARWRITVLAGYAAIGAAYLFVTDGGWPPLAIFGLVGWLAIRRRKLGAVG